MAVRAQLRNRSQAIDWSFLSRVEFWFEAMWLGVLAVVPLIFSFRAWTPTFDETKTYTLHFFALATLTLIAWDIAQNFAAARRRGEKLESIDVLAWLRRDTVHLLFAAVAAFMFVYVLSTALSPMPYYSLWGVTTASSGYNLYSFLSMMVIFFAVATRLRSVEQVWRVLYVVAAIGTITAIYGAAQHFGWDGIGLQGDQARVYATFGNPIHFGAYLVMSIPATIGIIASQRSQRKWVLGALAVALGLQVAAMWFTGSRGPVIGLVAALAAAGLALLTLRPRREVGMTAAVSAAAAVIAIGFILAPGGPGSSRAVQFGGQLSGLTDRAGGGRIQAGLAGRGEIWGDALELAISWERLPPDEGVARALRPMFGFGPDMYRFSTPLAAGPRSGLELVDHAHDRLLQVLMEEGWIGLAMFGAVIAVAAWLIFKTWRALRNDPSPDHLTVIAFVAVFGSLAGVAFEQLTGVGRAADLLTSWVLIALLAVVYRLAARRSNSLEAESAGTSRSPRPSRQSRRATKTGPVHGQAAASAVAFGAAVIVGVASVTLFILNDAQMFRAGRLAMGAFSITNADAAYLQYQDARSLAPQVEIFTVFPTEQLYDDARELLAQGDREQAAKLAEEAYIQLLQYHDRNPLAIHTRLALAETAALLVEIGVMDYQDEMVARYENIAQQFPTEIGVLAVVANSYVAGEQYEKGIEYAEKAIALEEATRPSPQAWWVKGEALERLERDDEAIASFETAIEKGPDSEFAALAHRSLADLLEERGDADAAAQHRTRADEIDAALLAARQAEG